MLGKLGILITILALVLAFYFVISLGAGRFSKGETKPETKRYLRSVNILLIISLCIMKYCLGNLK